MDGPTTDYLETTSELEWCIFRYQSAGPMFPKVSPSLIEILATGQRKLPGILFYMIASRNKYSTSSYFKMI